MTTNFKNQNPYPPDSMLHRAYNSAINKVDPQEFVNHLSDDEKRRFIHEFDDEWQSVCGFQKMMMVNIETTKTISDLRKIEPIAHILD